MSKQHPKYFDQDPELGPVEELNAMVGLGGLSDATSMARHRKGGARHRALCHQKLHRA